MKRKTITPRPNWEAKVEELGFGFHTMDGTYWDESAYYEFSMAEIETIEQATAELWDMCLEAVEHVVSKKKYDLFHIPRWIVPHIEHTWESDAPSVYGRFDFSFKDGVPKMLEFNADTPTSLFETGVVQWNWLEDRFPNRDQFNSVHDKLIGYWDYLKPYLYQGVVHFSVVKESLEDLTTVEYLRDTAIQAGLKTKLIYIDEIGWDNHMATFKDLEGHNMRNIFKLYPWEWLIFDEFGQLITKDRNKAHWIEPSWKMILSNKAILPILWDMFPDSDWLLPAQFDSVDLDSYVKKPILSREGANVMIVKDNQYQTHTEGEYGEEGFVYQGLCELPKFDNNYALIGSWVIGQEPAGIGIRESLSPITDNGSRFVPHIIV
ncbi:MAG: glutathionylspermidine synthase family protein [Saprospiraceae bacterium]|nr:glutathionylspermidine synthase family protein [Saprospiraceae bacterium]